ncbi:MAG: hypothetical protein AAB778_02755 [Patescibacteria group bacterium]
MTIAQRIQKAQEKDGGDRGLIAKVKSFMPKLELNWQKGEDVETARKLLKLREEDEAKKSLDHPRVA